MIKRNFKLGVDAGNISAIDEGFLARYDGKVNSKLCRLIKLPKGGYNVKVSVSETWREEKAVRSEIIEVTGKGIVIGDACYSFDKKWTELLDDTGFLKSFPTDSGFEVDTGGDGEFSVGVEITPVASGTTPAPFSNPQSELEQTVEIAVLEKEIELWRGMRNKLLAEVANTQKRADDLQDQIVAKRAEIVKLLKAQAAK
jgi:hypothetical protein